MRAAGSYKIPCSNEENKCVNRQRRMELLDSQRANHKRAMRHLRRAAELIGPHGFGADDAEHDTKKEEIIRELWHDPTSLQSQQHFSQKRFGTGFLRPIKRMVIEFHGDESSLGHYFEEFFHTNRKSLEESINEKLQPNGETGYIEFAHCESAVVPFFDTRLKVEFREKRWLHECTESELEKLRSDIINHKYPGRNESLEARLVQKIVQQCMKESSNDFYKQINITSVEDITRYNEIPDQIRRHLHRRPYLL